MSYAPKTDFIGLLRSLPDGTVRSASMPGLDYLVSALSRAGMVALWVDPTNPPSLNVATTVWLKASSTSWAAEGTVMLWDVATLAYLPATPPLWQAMFAATRRLVNPKVEPLTSRAVLAEEAGNLFTNGAAPLLQLTLPAAVLCDGSEFEFLQTATGALAVIVNNHGNVGADTLHYGVTGSNIGASSASQGSYLKVRAIDGVWWVIAAEGTWTLS